MEGKIRDFACRLPLNAITLNLFNRVVHFDGASGECRDVQLIHIYSNWSHCCTNDLPL